mmetsp:Transcript_53471/g.173999  ORF Transcript_53471/g.173999 Transcript_53471/m.173999 type:complete len:526 (+) Transcript_53471:62-1639(+)
MARSRSPRRQVSDDAGSDRASAVPCRVVVAVDTPDQVGGQYLISSVLRRVSNGLGTASGFLAEAGEAGDSDSVEDGLDQVAAPNLVSSVLRRVSGGLETASGLAGDTTANIVDRLGQVAGPNPVLSVLRRANIGFEAASGWLSAASAAGRVVTTALAMVREISGPIVSIPPPLLFAAACTWGRLQQAAAQQNPPAAEVRLPAQSERWLRFASASYGHTRLAGLVDGVSIPVLEGDSPCDAALACARIEGHVEVVTFEEATHMLCAPGHLVAVDHSSGAVVVALRGTVSVADALVDLAYKPEDIRLGGQRGIAHGGMLRAAKRLQDSLAACVDRGLARLNGHGPKRVVVCGHSLGAGVAALVTALWRDAARFPDVGVECFAFACPQVLDMELASAEEACTTTVVLEDDIVPRASFATIQDLRNAVLILSDPAKHGLERSCSSTVLRAAEARGDVAALAAAYADVRRLACTSSGRLFPAGKLIWLSNEGQARQLAPTDFDELRISPDMGSDHMPWCYMKAVQAVAGA